MNVDMYETHQHCLEQFDPDVDKHYVLFIIFFLLFISRVNKQMDTSSYGQQNTETHVARFPEKISTELGEKQKHTIVLSY